MICLGKKRDWSSEPPRLFQVRQNQTNRIQIHEQQSFDRFHNGACFVSLVEERFTIWKAASSSQGLVLQLQQYLEGKSKHPVQIVQQGSEPPLFWSSLGLGAALEIHQNAYFSQERIAPRKRLFRISHIVLGNATADEIEATLSQQQLEKNGVFILDAYTELFVWLGYDVCTSKESKHELIKLALDTALEYADIVEAEDQARLSKRQATLIRQGGETPAFKSHFLFWRDYKDKPLQRKHSFLLTGRAVDAAVCEMAEKRWPVAEIRDMLQNGSIPLGVDPRRIQDYLSNEEFQALFRIDRAAFDALPEWKKLAKRREAGLV
ncbi:hypothetical protein HDU91_003283 [Kappamyces sp. JEL0680]|nr:hypothetical protein HDU91_003283 [Kappamyces sp. JEL0680]